MRFNVYDNVGLIGGATLPPQTFSGSSAVNGNVVDTENFGGADNAAIYGVLAALGNPSSVTIANLVVTLQESDDAISWSNALDNTSTVIGYTLTAIIGVTGTTSTSSSPTVITAVSSVTGLYVGQPISGTGIPAGSVITAVGTTTITISNAVTASNTGTALTFGVEGLARIEGLHLNRKRYLRGVVTPAFTGGSSPNLLGAVAIVLGNPGQRPTDAAVSNT